MEKSYEICNVNAKPWQKSKNNKQTKLTENTNKQWGVEYIELMNCKTIGKYEPIILQGSKDFMNGSATVEYIELMNCKTIGKYEPIILHKAKENNDWMKI